MLILDLGGDAALVGLIVAAHSIPSVLLRPFIGQLIDSWSQRNVWMLGTLGLALSSLLYALPTLWSVGLVRLLHGTSWAAFNTGASTVLSRFAPPARRAEAAGMFGLMPSLANMLLPGVGLILVGTAGMTSAFVVAGVLAMLATLAVYLGPFPRGPLSDAAATRGFSLRNLIEPRALMPMAMEALWTGANVLFFVFPPVFCVAKDIPVEELVLYYPIGGGALILTRLIAGPRLDRVSRVVSLTVAVASGVCALLMASMAETIAMLTVAVVIWAFGTTFVSPIAMALAIERGHPQRQGASMATFSIGYQLGFGGGSLAWGLVVTAFGFPAPFLLAILPVAAIAAITWRSRGRLASVGAG